MIGREIMTSSSSFIDLVVLDSIREHFVSGAILTVTTEHLDQIIWANAAGAQAFGNTTLVNAAGSDTIFTRVQQRQILNGLHSGKASLVRVGADLVSISAQTISIDGEDAILLLAPQSQRHHDQAGQSFGMIDGLEEDNSRAAILDADGQTIVATETFDALHISQQTLSDLIAEVSSESDRLVKRPIASAFGEIPSAIACLNENRFLLMAIVAKDAQTTFLDDTSEEEPTTLTDDSPASHVAVAHISGETDTVKAEPDHTPDLETINPILKDDDQADRTKTLSAVNDEARPQVQRFVWKTNEEHVLVEVSEGFLDLIEDTEENLVGQEFQSILAQYGIERDPIDALMARQDTWSGVDVTFNAPEQDVSAIVTLSALPQRDASNEFSGYRGFGLIRHVEPTVLTEATQDDAFERLEPDTDTALEDDEPDHIKDITAENPDLFDPQDAPAALEEVSQLSDANKAANDKAPTEVTEQSGNLNDKERAAFTAIREQLTASVPGALANRTEETAEKLPSAAQKNNVVSLAPKPTPPKEPDNRDNGETISPRFIPSAFAAIDLLPRQGNIELVALDQLPLAIMLQRGDDIIYANDQLLNLTGFDDISAIANAGGLNALFEEPETSTYTNSMDDARAVMRLKTDAQDGMDAEAHIQVVNFEDSKALLLALVPIDKETVAQTDPITTPSAIVPALGTTNNPDEITGLKAQVEELHGILDTATDGVILLDGVANIRSLNHSAEALFGYENDAVRGRPFTTLFAIESHRGAMEYLTALTDNGVASVLNDGLEVIGREKEGRFIPLFMTLGRLAGSNGYCAVLRDITHWKRAEENLNLARQDAEAASTQKTAFLARMSHEIRTPLNAIIGFSDLMLDERFSKVKDERSREYLKDINKSGGLVLDLVNDLLDLTKIESGEQEMEFSAVSINELLRESVSMMQPRANQQRVIIRSSLNADLPEVVADARSIKQIALNLLSNAIRFTKAGGQVIASSAIMDDGCVAIRIRDTGIGMTEDEIQHAMQPYKQVKNDDVIATKEGSGLGLPLTKAMVDGNRAEMSITSTPDVGTIVEIIFPANRVLSE